MHHLFSTNKVTLKEAIADYNMTNIPALFTPTIVARGYDYFKNNNVQTITNKDSNSLVASVSGNEIYKVTIQLNRNNVLASCTCAYDDCCKHIAAVLFTVVNQTKDLPDTQAVAKEQVVTTYLKNLSKDDLVNLVLEYAPNEFMQRIANLQAQSSEADKKLHIAKNNFEILCNSKALQYGTDHFTDELTRILHSLNGLESKLRPEMGDFLLHILQISDKMISDGDLYCEYEDTYELPHACYDALFDYCMSLPLDDKVEFVLRFFELHQTFDVDCFDTSALKDVFVNDEIPHLATYIQSHYNKIPQSFLTTYFSLVELYLTLDQQADVLQVLLDKKDVYFLKYLQILETQNKLAEAIACIDSKLQRINGYYSISHELFVIKLRLQTKANEDVLPTLRDFFAKLTNANTLRYINTVNAKLATELEQELRIKSADEFVRYTESCGRIDETESFIYNNPSLCMSISEWFYKKHRKAFVNHATACFQQVIEQNLLQTGDTYYTKIVDMLKLIKDIDSDLCKQLIERYKTEYKRRSNFIQKMNVIA